MFFKFRPRRPGRLEPAELTELKRYIDSHLILPQEICEAADISEEAFYEPPSAPLPKHDRTSAKGFPREKTSAPRQSCRSDVCSAPMQGAAVQAPAISLSEALRGIDESFSEMVLRKIDESGMTDAKKKKKAQLDRKLFSKLRGNRLYKPSRQTAVALALALELSLEETRELLMKAGFALSHSSKFDIIIEYFISKGNYNRFEINEALYEFDQPLI